MLMALHDRKELSVVNTTKVKISQYCRKKQLWDEL